MTHSIALDSRHPASPAARITDPIKITVLCIPDAMLGTHVVAW